MNLYIVRHGETDYNVQHIVQAISNTKLNNTGIMQANNLKKEIDLLNIDLIICSPLLRTKQTANIITNGRNIETIYDDRIIERSAGKFEGKSDKYYDHIKVWDYKLNTDLNQGIEKVQDLFKRAKLFLNDIKQKYPNKNILIVTHEATIRAIHYNIIGYNENTNLKELKINNCCLLKYKI